MTLQRHPPDEWLVAHAAASHDEAHAFLVAVHLVFCPSCRELLDDAEHLAARALEAVDPVAVDPDGLDALLDRLDAVPEGSDPVVPDARPGMPSLVAPYATGRWRWLAPGTWGIDLPHATSGELPLRLVWMRAGTDLPHRHRGDEVALVLSGGWTDQHGHVGPGDCHVSDDRDQHAQIIDAGEPCVALVLAERKAEPPARWRWLGPFFRI